jgi:hypothetical protein
MLGRAEYNAYKRQEATGYESSLTVVRFGVLTTVLMRIQVSMDC